MYRRVVLVIVLVCIFNGDRTRLTDSALARPTKSSVSIVDGFSGYFPIDVGTRWSYTITVYDVSPVIYEEIQWPVNDALSVFTQHFLQLNPTRVSYTLTFSVAETTTFDAGVPSESVLIAVETDELGLLIVDSVSLVKAYPRDSIVVFFARTYAFENGAPSKATDDGYGRRPVVFSARPHMNMSLSYAGSDSLTFSGVESSAFGYEDSTLLHYQRRVNATIGDNKETGAAVSFTEDMWYAQGIGLVRLEQRRSGQLSMVWVLDLFTPAS